MVDGGIVRWVGLCLAGELRRSDSADSGEVTVEGLSRGEVGEFPFLKIKRVVEKSAGAGGVDEKLCRDGDGLVVARAGEFNFRCALDDSGE